MPAYATQRTLRSHLGIGSLTWKPLRFNLTAAHLQQEYAHFLATQAPLSERKFTKIFRNYLRYRQSSLLAAAAYALPFLYFAATRQLTPRGLIKFASLGSLTLFSLVLGQFLVETLPRSKKQPYQQDPAFYPLYLAILLLLLSTKLKAAYSFIAPA